MSETEVQEKKLNEDTELRIVVNEGEAIVELVDGRAEIFGSELVKNKKYLFQKGNCFSCYRCNGIYRYESILMVHIPGSRIAIFTYEGATVDVVGSGVHSYTSDETPMVRYQIYLLSYSILLDR